MKTKRIFLTLMAVLILLTQTVMAKDYSDYPQKFWDVSKDHWAYEYISELADKNVISGYTDGSFKPEETVSRAEWSKMLVVASGKQPVTLEDNKSYAVDYNSNDWCYGYINSVISYMNFYNDGGNYYFKPSQSASREDVTVSLVKLKGYSVDNVDYSYISKFKDSNSISNELKKYIAVAIEKELISGYEDNTFRGQDTLTRAEAATLLCRAFQLGNDNKTTNSNSVYLDGSDVNSNVSNETNKEESNNASNGDLSDSENSSGNTIINNNNTTINNTTINNNGNGNVNVNNGTINNNSSDISDNEENTEDEEENEETPYHKYAIDTLIEANTEYRLYTMNEDMLYYVDGDSIYSVDTITGDKETVIDFEDIDVTYEGKTYTASNIKSLFYDNENDTLAVYGDFENKTIFGDSSGIYARAVSVPDCEYLEIKKSMSDYPHILGVTSNGYVVDQYGIELLKNNEFTSLIRTNAIDYCETEEGLYFINPGKLTYYDFNDSEVMYDFKNITSTGINEEYVVFIGNNYFLCVNEESKSFSTEDIQVKDYCSLNTNAFEKLSFVNSNNDIIVYDKVNGSFRIIYENK